MIRSVTLISMVLTMLNTAIVTPIPLMMVRTGLNLAESWKRAAQSVALRTSIGRLPGFAVLVAPPSRQADSRRAGRQRQVAQQSQHEINEQVAWGERFAAGGGLPRLDLPPFEDVLNPPRQHGIAHVPLLLDIKSGQPNRSRNG